MSNIQNLNSYDPFADEGSFQSKQVEPVHIRLQQRNGRKTLTTVQGVHKDFDPKKILKYLKKKYACNGTIIKDSDMGNIIQLQGDHRTRVLGFLVTLKNEQEEYVYTQDNVKVHGF